jgi:hypothetical protein
MTMTELSPAAQTVLSAYVSSPIKNGDKPAIAAVLRAATDEVCLRWSELQHPADVLNAIADELETQ